MVADQNDNYEVGAYVLYLLDAKQTSAACALLNWKREVVKRSDNDDPLGGPLLPRFWKADTRPADTTREAMQIAAASLVADSVDAKTTIPAVMKAIVDLKPDALHVEQRRVDLQLLLARMYLSSGEGPQLVETARALRTAEPESIEAIQLAGSGFALTKNYTPWTAMLQERLTSHPDDHDLEIQQMRELEVKGDYLAAQAMGKKITEGKHANASDFNTYAWISLFSGQFSSDADTAAQQAVLQTNSRSFATLHTLASLDAAEGKVLAARTALLQAMQAANLEVPIGSVWYVQGLIAEQLNRNKRADQDFRLVDGQGAEGTLAPDPVATWLLAEREITRLSNVH